MTDQSNPIPRGATGFQGATPNTTTFAAQLGQVREFPDVNPDPNATTLTTKTNLRVQCILLRNTSGGALLPKDVIKIDPTDPSRNASAKSSAANQHIAVVDEYLPAAGVPANDVFWAVIKGPTTAKFATVSGAKAAGGLPVGSSGTAGKLDFTTEAPGSATIAQQGAIYGSEAFTEGAIADGATEARVYLNDKFFGY
jgi:hypothetical protein